MNAPSTDLSYQEYYTRQVALEEAREAEQAKADAEARERAQKEMRQAIANFDHAKYHGFKPEGRTRFDGWTPEKQRMFLEAMSEGHAVTKACAIVGMKKQSAYALRASPRGAGFALGWAAAVLLARNALADEMMERAFNGVQEWVEDENGNRCTRLRHDNRHGMAVLNRLDRMADAQNSSTEAAARLIATDFPQFLDLIERDAGPARAGIFLGARIEGSGQDELAPIRTLARADRWLRTNKDVAEPIDALDLDPAERAQWTGEQWALAEEAGLVQLAPAEPEPEKSPTSQVSQFSDTPAADEPVWWDEEAGEWRTHFPPPEGFDGDEYGDFEDEDYHRSLTDEEAEIMGDDPNLYTPEDMARFVEDRDAYFAARAAKLQRELEQGSSPARPAALAAPSDDVEFTSTSGPEEDGAESETPAPDP